MVVCHSCTGGAGGPVLVGLICTGGAGGSMSLPSTVGPILASPSGSAGGSMGPVLTGGSMSSPSAGGAAHISVRISSSSRAVDDVAVLVGVADGVAVLVGLPSVFCHLFLSLKALDRTNVSLTCTLMNWLEVMVE